MHDDTQMGHGPLQGIRIVEFAGLGPAPYGCMVLADLGADVVVVDRPGRSPGDARNIVGRNRRVIEADLKNADARAEVLTLIAQADVLVESFRPGVMERLGLGPDAATARNPRLVYARMTGWGQDGPLAHTAGHDINYIAITGALDAIGTKDSGPVAPLNLLGDYAGGGLFLAVGVLSALQERSRSGRGQVIDVAIVDGVLSLMATTLSRALRGMERESRASNMFDGGAPFYRCYATSDGGYVSVGALEPQFFALLADRIGLPESLRPAHADRARWDELGAELSRIFASRTRAEWTALLQDCDACAAPVLPLSEALDHPHLVARGALTEFANVRQPAPAPRFSRTPGRLRHPSPDKTISTAEAIAQWALKQETSP